ncbi:MAG: M15 family metallopeptidase [Chitinispirillaceae bacterium]|nr:M15 family metallopeptidase [Chitinispirillaceae bacterium]
MASRDINDLLPPVRARAVELDQLCDAAFEGSALSTAIVCTYRDPREQEALYLQGRASIDAVNAARAAIRLLTIMMRENVIRTNARPGNSAHEFRCAFDLLAFEGGRVIHCGDHPAYRIIGELGESAGLEWSGRWPRKPGRVVEAAHFQYLGGLTLADLQKGKKPE